jgi:hypothetical protein
VIVLTEGLFRLRRPDIQLMPRTEGSVSGRGFSAVFENRGTGHLCPPLLCCDHRADGRACRIGDLSYSPTERGTFTLGGETFGFEAFAPDGGAALELRVETATVTLPADSGRDGLTIELPFRLTGLAEVRRRTTTPHRHRLEGKGTVRATFRPERASVLRHELVFASADYAIGR